MDYAGTMDHHKNTKSLNDWHKRGTPGQRYRKYFQ